MTENVSVNVDERVGMDNDHTEVKVSMVEGTSQGNNGKSSRRVSIKLNAASGTNISFDFDIETEAQVGNICVSEGEGQKSSAQITEQVVTQQEHCDAEVVTQQEHCDVQVVTQQEQCDAQIVTQQEHCDAQIVTQQEHCDAQVVTQQEQCDTQIVAQQEHCDVQIVTKQEIMVTSIDEIVKKEDVQEVVVEAKTAVTVDEEHVAEDLIYVVDDKETVAEHSCEVSTLASDVGDAVSFDEQITVAEVEVSSTSPEITEIADVIEDTVSQVAMTLLENVETIEESGESAVLSNENNVGHVIDEVVTSSLEKVDITCIREQEETVDVSCEQDVADNNVNDALTLSSEVCVDVCTTAVQEITSTDEQVVTCDTVVISASSNETVRKLEEIEEATDVVQEIYDVSLLLTEQCVITDQSTQESIDVAIAEESLSVLTDDAECLAGQQLTQQEDIKVVCDTAGVLISFADEFDAKKRRQSTSQEQHDVTAKASTVYSVNSHLETVFRKQNKTWNQQINETVADHDVGNLKDWHRKETKGVKKLSLFELGF